MLSVGVLAFQGDVAEHVHVLSMLDIQAIEVRTPQDVARVSGLIIPGGESTVMSHFLHVSGVGVELQRRVHETRDSFGIFGTCAGAILLARSIVGRQKIPNSLGLIDMVIERNAYGRQAESFEASLTVEGVDRIVSGAFIRAPKILSVGSDVHVLATHAGSPVFVQQGRLFAATFHPELRDDSSLHRLFCTSLA